MSNQISILSCILLLGIICCIHGRESKAFGSNRGEKFMERAKLAPGIIKGVKFAVEKDPANVAQIDQE